MSSTHYRAYNAQLLQSIAGEKHSLWLKSRDKQAKKHAKKHVKPALGTTLHSLRALKGFKVALHGT